MHCLCKIRASVKTMKTTRSSPLRNAKVFAFLQARSCPCPCPAATPARTSSIRSPAPPPTSRRRTSACRCSDCSLVQYLFSRSEICCRCAVPAKRAFIPPVELCVCVQRHYVQAAPHNSLPSALKCCLTCKRYAFRRRWPSALAASSCEATRRKRCASVSAIVSSEPAAYGRDVCAKHITSCIPTLIHTRSIQAPDHAMKTHAPRANS